MPVPGPSLLVRVTDAQLDPGEALAFVSAAGVGGTVLFSGTVRDHSDAGVVTGLEYEAWEERAERALRDIGAELFDRWPIHAAALLHRTVSRRQAGWASRKSSPSVRSISSAWAPRRRFRRASPVAPSIDTHRR